MFWCCQSLASIGITPSVKSIGRRAFEGCKNLTSIKTSFGVTTIGDGAFSGCENLTSIKLPRKFVEDREKFRRDKRSKRVYLSTMDDVEIIPID